MTRTYKVFALVALFGAVVWLHARDLDFPIAPYYDEVYHVPSARHLLLAEKYIDVHPPLGHILHATGMALLGDNSWAWRVTSLIASIGLIVVLFLWVRKMSRDTLLAAFAAFIFAVDCLSITQGRIMMHNSLMLLFMMLSLYFMSRMIANTDNRVKLRDWCLSAVFLGLAAATRWVAFSMLPILVAYFFIFSPRGSRIPGLMPRAALYFVVALIFYGIPHLVLPFLEGWHWKDIWQTNAYMAKYHWNLKEGHYYGSAWWTWPFMKRPIWYFYENIHGIVRGILVIGNPVVFWAIIPVTLFTLWQAIAKHELIARFCLAAFFISWVPWAALSRVQFFHYFYPVMPFIVVMTALMLKWLWNANRWGRLTVLIYMAGALGMFIYWYPLLTAYPIPESFFRQHMWFKTWV